MINALSAAASRPTAETTMAIFARRTQANHPLHLRHFGGSSRASRRHKMSIQRFAPVFPPVISAEVLQIVQIGSVAWTIGRDKSCLYLFPLPCGILREKNIAYE